MNRKRTRRFSRQLERRIVQLYLSGISSVQLADRYGCTASRVASIMQRHNRSMRTLVEAARLREGKPLTEDPTPEQIAERTAKIREDWDEEEHRYRAGIPKRTPYEFPLISQLQHGIRC